MNRDYNEHIAASVEYIKAKVGTLPPISVILGSGLGDFGDLLTEKISLETKDIPYYPVSSVEGHAGRLLFGKLKSAENSSAGLLVFQGRIHFYESNDTDIVVYPIEVARRLGTKTLVVTNAAGGVNASFIPGDLMIISDYVNLSFENPLIARANEKTRISRPGFSPNLIALARKVASEHNIPVKEGIYCWTKGPSYESAAEIRMMASWGVDAVGMSTVPEVILASSYGMEVLGISCITNLATGLAPSTLNHDEVREVANKVKHNFSSLLSKIIMQL